MKQHTQTPQFATIDWLPDGSAYCRRHRDRYSSAAGALGESEHNFLAGNDLERRWRRLGKGALFSIGEIGFGAGRNFLSAWALWQRCAPPDARLHYLAAERYPMHCHQLARAVAVWPQLSAQAKALLAVWPPPLPGSHRLALDDGRVQLSLLIDDATAAFAQHPVGPGIDAWFLDGFAPVCNADAWSSALCHQLRRHSRKRASYATYSAAGGVRRQLRKHGFAVRCVAGYGSKSESLRGRLASGGRRPPQSRPNSALVVGAGIVGAASARQLADRGLSVTVLERGEEPACGASGQPATVIYPRFSASWTPQARFALAAYLHALRLYPPLLSLNRTLIHRNGGFPGLLQLASDPALERRCHQLTERYAECPELLRAVDATQASQLAGITLNHGGLFYPGGGWLVPARACSALLDHPSIHCLFGEEVHLHRAGRLWCAATAQGVALAKAQCAVLATGTGLSPAPPLPLRALRGQSSGIAATRSSAALRTVLCHRGYLLPPQDGHQQLGATYGRDDQSSNAHEADHQLNLAQLSDAVPALAAELPLAADCTGSVGFRYTSPDHLPLVGAVRGQAGLYVNLGHGSAGVAQAPLCAELLSCRILNEPPPLAGELLRTLAPGRFDAPLQ